MYFQPSGMDRPPTSRFSLFLDKLFKLLYSPSMDTVVVFIFFLAMAAGWVFFMEQVFKVAIETWYLIAR